MNDRVVSWLVPLFLASYCPCIHAIVTSDEVGSHSTSPGTRSFGVNTSDSKGDAGQLYNLPPVPFLARSPVLEHLQGIEYEQP